MLKQKERILRNTAASIAISVLVALVIWRVAFFIPAAQSKTQEPNSQAHESQSKTDHNHKYIPRAENKKQPVTTIKETAKKDAELNAEPKLKLKEIVKAARTWGPIYTSWYGKKAPDFTLKDINGKEHKLSDYKGKDVIIIFWATWCGPCIMEVPHLIALRNTISEDKLAMLAISNEKLTPVKKFAADRKINYTVLTSGTSDMPTPYSQVRNIPCSFFIDSKGTIKLATEGLLSLGEIKAILRAE